MCLVSSANLATFIIDIEHEHAAARRRAKKARKRFFSRTFFPSLDLDLLLPPAGRRAAGHQHKANRSQRPTPTHRYRRRSIYRAIESSLPHLRLEFNSNISSNSSNSSVSSNLLIRKRSIIASDFYSHSNFFYRSGTQ